MDQDDNAVPVNGALSRRQVVGGAAVGAATLAVPAAAEAKKKKKAKPKPRKVDVVVVGAGLAGLVAARDLRRAGKSVVVMEARSRVGGRCFSKPIGPGITEDVANLGATFIGDTQKRITALVKELGMNTFPVYNTGKNVLYFNGKRDTYTGAIPPIDIAALLEAQNGITKLNQMAQTVPLNAPWEAAEADAWDSQTFDTFKRAEAKTENGRKLLELAIEAIFSVQARDVSLLYVLHYIHAAGNLDQLINTDGGAQETRVEGGTQKISIELAKRIGKKRVLLNTPVRQIVQKKGRVEVISDKVTVYAKRVIVAVPPPIAGRIRYSPGLPALRDQLTQRMPLGSVTKTFAIYDRPFWRDDGLTGQITSDTGPVKITFDGSPKSGTPGVLLGFVDGEDARILNAKPPAERAKLEIESYVRYFGPKAANPKRVFDYAWDNDRIARGAPICFAPPGTYYSFGRALRAPCDRIHWAGTETATEWTGYMDGAVQSGGRAAAEVIAGL